MVTQNRTAHDPSRIAAHERRTSRATDSNLLRRLGALEIVILVVGAVLVGI